MKDLIRQILKESAMESLIDSMFPQLNNLKSKSNYNANKYGANTIYYNKEDKEYYFRVSEPRKVYYMNWETDKLESRENPKTVYVDARIYDEIENYIPNEDMILKWFNEKYKQNAKKIIRRYPLKER